MTGQYVPETDEQAITVTHGYSKDHRPDLKQAILELVVSQDGDVPIISKNWNGNANDNTVFKERSEALIEQFSASEPPRYLIADSKLYTQANAQTLAKLPFITRIPETIKMAQSAICQAWAADGWQILNDQHRYFRIDLSHYSISQRWLVIFSQSAAQRAKQTLPKACAKELEKVSKQLFHLQAQRFESQAIAGAALEKIAKKWKYHRVSESTLCRHLQYAQKGSPTQKMPIKRISWQICAQVVPDQTKIIGAQQRKSCFVIGTSIADTALTDFQVFDGYKGQSAVEGGFRFLKDPVFFVSSL